MKATKVPLDNLGGSGVFGLMAGKLSSPPCAACPPTRQGTAPATAQVTQVMRLMAEADVRDSFLVSRPLYTRYAPGLTSEAGRAITVSGMWSGVGFVGASIVAAGLLLLIDGGATAGIALALILSGGAVATFGWRSAWKALDRIDQMSASATAARAPAAATTRDNDNGIARRIASAHPRTALGAR